MSGKSDKERIALLEQAKVAQELKEKEQAGGKGSTPPATTAQAPSSSQSTKTVAQPSALSTPKVQGKFRVTADMAVKTTKAQWADIVALIVQEIADNPDFYLYAGGLSPVDRRAALLDHPDLKVSHLKWFVATCEMRGHHIVSFTKKTDVSGQNLLELHKILIFKGKVGVDAPGKVSVVAVKVAISDIFIAFRKMMGPAKFKEVEYNGPCAVPYQWNGGLAAYYDPMEEQDKVGAWKLYIESYEHYQDWYISVRSAAAKNNPQKNKNYKEKTPEEFDKAKADAKMKTRSFYRLTLASFSIATRRAWYNGNYDVVVEKGDPIDETIMATLLKAIV